MEGIVLRQVKTLKSRRMIQLFSLEKGKIGAGTSISEKGKSKSALAMRPFTLGDFDVTENKGYYNINGADTIKSYFKIGDDLSKFANASFVLEVTEKMLPDEIAQPVIFELLKTYLEILEKRKRSYETMTIAFLVKALQANGVAPHIEKCQKCGDETTAYFFHIGEAGYLCKKCGEPLSANGFQKLLYKVNFDIVRVLTFLMNNSIERVAELELRPEVAGELLTIMKDYTVYHLDIGNLKSEQLLDL